MREPSFWWQPPGIQSALLAPISAVYGAIAGTRMRQSGRSAGIPIICVGNLTVGGAGKTPAALAIAQMLIAAGRRVFFLSRGYGGQAAGPVRVDAARHSAVDVGDEPLLLARIAPTIVAQDRVAGAEAARAAGAKIVIMDDGFQNPSLIKNFSIVVVDGRRGIGNGRVIPAGPLRAPLRSQLAYAHALLLIDAPSATAAPVIAAAEERGIPIFHARMEADADAVSSLSGQRILAFAGIGDPEKFFATLAESGVTAPVTQGFPDHHRYSRAEADALLVRAAQDDLLLVTTEKDLARFARDYEVSALANAVRALPVTVRIDEDDELRELLLKKTR